MNRRDAITAVGAVALGGAQQAFAQQPIVIKFSHVVTNDTPKGKGALKFKELAEKYTGGKVKVEVYPNSTLYKDKEELDALNSGSVQMLAPSTAKFRPIGVPEFEALDLPYIFENVAAYEKVATGPIGQSLMKKLEPKGIAGLAYWDNGFHMVSANKPLLMPADFPGPEDPHLGLKGGRPVLPRDGRAAADHGLPRRLPGAADRRLECLRKTRLQTTTTRKFPEVPKPFTMSIPRTCIRPDPHPNLGRPAARSNQLKRGKDTPITESMPRENPTRKKRLGKPCSLTPQVTRKPLTL